MMKRFQKILVATDSRYDEHPVVEKAVEVAGFTGSTIKIVDVVPEMPWMARLAIEDHEHIQDLLKQEKLKRLEQLAEPLRKKGLTVEIEILIGKTSIELIREVVRNEFDLVMAVAKGKDSRQTGFYGQTAKQLLRKCPCAVWLVTGAAKSKLKHVLACLDTSSDDSLDAELNETILALAKSVSKFHDGEVSIAHAWSVWNEPMLKSRLQPDEFAEHVNINRKQTRLSLEKFIKSQGANVPEDNIYLFKGEPRDVISQLVIEAKIDLVVMGTVARSGLSGMVMGNTAEKILDRLECSVLALKPASFHCPVQMTK